MAEITVLPVVGWDTKLFGTAYGLLNISYLPGLPQQGMTQAQLETAKQSLQLGIAAEQAELLAQDLLTMVGRLREAQRTAN